MSTFARISTSNLDEGLSVVGAEDSPSFEVGDESNQDLSSRTAAHVTTARNRRFSRAVGAVTTWLERTLADRVLVAADLTADEHYIVDGTLVPCWSWRDRRELYSGKHQTTGVNLQVVCDLSGTLRWVSNGADGCRRGDCRTGRSPTGVVGAHRGPLSDAYL